MKIQTYNAKIRRTDKIASQPLNIQANSAAFESVGQGAVSLGNSISSLKKWADTEQKIVNATEVATASRSYKDKLIELEEDIAKTPALNANPKMAKNHFKKQSTLLFAQSRATITGQKAKATFGTDAADQAAISRLRISKLARSRMVSETVAKTLEEVKGIEQELSELNPNTNAYKVAYNKLYGLKNNPGKFDHLESIGYITAENRLKYEQKSRSNIESNQINKIMLGAQSLSGTADDLTNGAAAKQAYQLTQELNDPKKYPNLDVSQRQQFKENALNLAQSLERRRVSQFNQSEKQAKTVKAKFQDENFLGFTERILSARTELNDSDLQKKIPSELEIARSFALKQISNSQKDILIKALNDQGAVVTDQKFLSGLIDRIDAADSKKEIEAIIKKASARTRDKLTFADIRTLRGHAQGVAGSTPRMKRVKIFRQAIINLTKADGIIDKIMPGAGKKGGQVKVAFDMSVLEGVDPKIAFDEAIEAYNTNEKVVLKEIPLPKFLPSYQNLDANKSGEVFNRDLSTWTLRPHWLTCSRAF